MTPLTFTSLHLNTGLYPLSTLVMGAVLWIIFRLFLFKKCPPQTSLSFTTAGVCIIVLSGFVNITTRYPSLEITDHTTGDVQQAEIIESPLLLQIPIRLSLPPNNKEIPDDAFSIQDLIFPLLIGCYVLGVTLLLYQTLRQLHQLRQLRKTARFIRKYDKWNVYETALPGPFSYGRHIFLPASTDNTIRPCILAHEASHLRHKHFLQLCTFRGIIIIGWFNPFLWLLLADIKMLHEMQADNDALSTGINRSAYQMSLLTVCTHNPHSTHIGSSFGCPPLKARILFMNRRINRIASRWRILTAIVLFTGMAVAILGCQTSPTTALQIHTEDESIPGKHPLYGTWRLIKLGDAQSSEMNEWPREQYKFYGNDLFFNIHIKKGTTQSPNSVYEGASGSFKYISSTEVEEHGRRCHISIKNDSILIFTYTNSDGVSAIDAPVVTEEWVRCDTPDMIKEMINIVD